MLQSKLRMPMPPRRWTDGPENVNKTENEQHRESFKPGSSAKSSDKWRTDYDLRNTGDSRPSFSSKMKENLGSMIGTEVNLHEKIYASPVLCTQFLGNDSSDSDHGTKLFVGNGDISDISHTSEAPVAICSQGDHLALLTAHSASDVNRSMDLLSAKLPKSASDKDLESRGKGTTTMNGQILHQDYNLDTSSYSGDC